MMIRAISPIKINTNLSFKKDEKAPVKDIKAPSNNFDSPQIWFSSEIGPNGREMMGSHLIGYSDVIGPDGTRAPIYETRY